MTGKIPCNMIFNETNKKNFLKKKYKENII